MDKESFLDHLRHPDGLAHVGMEELLALTLRYPYAANLRLLVLRKALETHDPSTEHYLNRAAAATFDRAHLHDILHAAEAEQDDETLELRELEELELLPVDADKKVPSPIIAAATPSMPTEPEQIPASEPPPSPVDTPAPPSSRISINRWVAIAAAFNALQPIETPAEADLPTTPESLATFGEPSATRPVDLRQRLRRLRDDRQGSDAAGRSAVAPRVVVSETLADLLVKQGRYRDAIKMYRRLGLLYPEKKPIFAALIQELKEKL